MLKLNGISSENIEYLEKYLNTSHVKVKHIQIAFMIECLYNLNTSHVKVKLLDNEREEQERS